MPIAQSLATMQANAAQCDHLIASAHLTDPQGAHLLSQRDREQVVEAAFLNLFIAWEEFLESAFLDYMTGDLTTNGIQPTRYVAPPDRAHAGKMILHINKYFDFANHEFVLKAASLFFAGGIPFRTPMNGIAADLTDLRTIRNACAHMSSTTRNALETLALRILGQPQPGINVYRLLTQVDPRIPGNLTTIYQSYRDKLLAAASIISSG